MKPARLRDAPISGKLRITILLTCAAALLCATAAMFAIQYHAFQRAYWEEVQAAAEAAANSLPAALARDNSDGARRILQALIGERHIVGARFVLKDGSVLADEGNGTGGASRAAGIVADGETIGTLELRTDFSAQVMKMLGLHVVLFVAALVIAFLVAVLVSERLFRSIVDPIKTLGDTARQIAARDDYSLRAAKSGEDEVGAFTDTFNSMLAQIQGRDQELRREIAERERAEQEVQRIHEELMEASRQAGMAEVATGVLHNVGNVLNSVNLSATLVAEKLEPDHVGKLVRAANLLRDKDSAALADFLANDPKGKVLPLYLAEATAQLAAERAEAVAELALLKTNIDHIKDIVARQQNHARIAGLVEPADLAGLIEEALRMTRADIERSGIAIERDFAEVPLVMADRHQVLQIFVNLIRNARQAIDEANPPERTLTVAVRRQDARYVQAVFTDTGQGIVPENLTRIFSHGFTTREQGHGFGLHIAALAAQQMAGSLSAQSSGPGRGATFILELPVADTPAGLAAC